MKSSRLWLAATLLVVLAMGPAPLMAQDMLTLVGAVEGEPGLELGSDVVRFEAPTFDQAFGDELDAALDFGPVGALEFGVTRDADSSKIRIFEMIDSAAAFGWFAHEREYDESEYEPVVLGAEAYSNGDRLVFWQSRFVVRLIGERNLSIEAGRVISNAITGPSRKPPVAMLLPAASVPGSERYLLTPSVIEERLGLDLDGLGLEKSVEAAAAVYQDGASHATLALFQYPTPQLARLHSEEWMAANDGVIARRSGLLFGIVTSGDSDELAESVLSALRSQFEVTWNEPPRDPLTIQQIILTAFTWIGIALALTLVGGMGFGGLRVYMRKRYPTEILGGELDTEFLQLNINESVRRKQLPD